MPQYWYSKDLKFALLNKQRLQKKWNSEYLNKDSKYFIFRSGAKVDKTLNREAIDIKTKGTYMGED
jgi:hypothetical protein